MPGTCRHYGHCQLPGGLHRGRHCSTAAREVDGYLQHQYGVHQEDYVLEPQPCLPSSEYSQVQPTVITAPCTPCTPLHPCYSCRPLPAHDEARDLSSKPNQTKLSQGSKRNDPHARPAELARLRLPRDAYLRCPSTARQCTGAGPPQHHAKPVNVVHHVECRS